MRRPHLATTLVLCLLPPRLQGQEVTKGHAPAEVQRALAAYDSVFHRQDVAGIAGFFTPTGAMGSVGRRPVVGPDSIAAQLRRFADFHLLDEHLLPDSTRVWGDSAQVVGHYWQRVRLPAGDTVEARGTFMMGWVWVPGLGWRLRRLITDP